MTSNSSNERECSRKKSNATFALDNEIIDALQFAENAEKLKEGSLM